MTKKKASWHGTRYGYNVQGCRCQACTKADKEYTPHTVPEEQDDRYSGSSLIRAMDTRAVDIRNVMAYAVSIGALAEKDMKEMETDQFRSWVRLNRQFKYVPTQDTSKVR